MEKDSMPRTVLLRWLRMYARWVKTAVAAQCQMSADESPHSVSH